MDPLTEKQQEFVRVIELAEVQKHMKPYRWQGIGRKRDDRLAIVKAFVAKAFDRALLFDGGSISRKVLGVKGIMTTKCGMRRR